MSGRPAAPGGAVLAGGCLIERLALDFERRSDFCHYLLELRLALDKGRADPPGTRQLFYRLRCESIPAA